MDEAMNKSDGSDRTGSHIWLRYATQFTMNGRSVTVEMGIPVPLGASAEIRERLIREAEEGMEQLSSHIEGRVGSMVQRIQQASHASAAKQPATRPATPTSVPPAAKPPTPQSQPSQPAQSTPPTQSASTRETMPVASQEKEAAIPPTRMNVGASMPKMAATGDTAGNLSLPQFIQIIKDSLGLTPKQAMELLRVKSLTGLNLRDKLEELQSVTPSETANDPEPLQHPRGDTPSRSGERLPTNIGSRHGTNQPDQPPAPISNIVPISKKVPFEEITHAVIRETPPSYPAFDEELDDEDIEFADEPEHPQLEEHEREIAEAVLSRLREARGSSLASAVRLNALNNVIGGQISDQQLQQLIQGVWEVNSTKKLKNDQVEALVYWGKDDNFIEEAELVLALLEEDNNYARSDR
jgi:hypothetical protein